MFPGFIDTCSSLIKTHHTSDLKRERETYRKHTRIGLFSLNILLVAFGTYYSTSYKLWSKQLCVFYNKLNLIHRDTSFLPRDNSFISLKVHNGLQYVRKKIAHYFNEYVKLGIMQKKKKNPWVGVESGRIFLKRRTLKYQ